MASTNDWRFGGSGTGAVTVQPRLAVNSADAAIDSALRHQGLTRVLSYQVAEHLRSGRLVRVLPEHEPAALPVQLLYPASRRGAPNVAALVREARRYFAMQRLD